MTTNDEDSDDEQSLAWSGAKSGVSESCKGCDVVFLTPVGYPLSMLSLITLA